MRLAATTALASVLAAPAFGGALIFDPPAPEPVAAPAPAPIAAPALANWTGPYAGAQFGWGRAEADIAIDGVGVSPTDGGFIGGVHAGYDWQFPNGFVLGGELAYDRANASPSTAGFSAEVDNVVRLTARGGFGFGDSLVYARAGAAWLDGDTTVGGVTSGASDWGWVAGAGFEQRITPSITAGVEGLYHDVSDFGGAEVNLWTVQARVSWRF